MPTYSYVCKKCEHGFEVLRADEPREEYLLQRVAGA